MNRLVRPIPAPPRAVLTAPRTVLSAAPGTVLAALVAASLAAVLVLGAGAFPWIPQTAWYSGLAVFVAFNTFAFAFTATVKLGYHSGSAAVVGALPLRSPHQAADPAGPDLTNATARPASPELEPAGRS